MRAFALIRGGCTRAIAIFRRAQMNAESVHFRSHERFRRMALSSATALGSRAITIATSLISIPLTYRYLGAERYGMWMVLTSIIGVMTFADLGIGNGLVNAISEAYGKGDRELATGHLTSALTLLIGIAAIVCASGLVSYPFIPWMRVLNVKSAFIAAEGARAFLVLFLWFVVNIPLGVVARVQSGFQEAYWSHALSACGSIISLATLVTVVLFQGSLPLLVFASTFGTILAASGNAWLLFRRRPWLLPRPAAFDAGSAKLILKLGFMFFALQVTATFGYNSDNIVITQILGVSAVSVYAVPQKLFSVVSILVAIGLGPIWPAYSEAFARGDIEWARETFLRSIRWIMMAVGPACAVLVLVGPRAVRLVMGASLQIPFSLFVVLGVWAAVSAVSNAMSVLLNGASVLRGQTIIGLIAGSSNLLLSIVLTRRFGIIGVCLGSIIAQLAIAIPAYTFLTKGLFSGLSNMHQRQHRLLQHGS
jgi:O-antigen/teichoic acid export membrane protein